MVVIGCWVTMSCAALGSLIGNTSIFEHIEGFAFIAANRLSCLLVSSGYSESVLGLAWGCCVFHSAPLFL
ncbi:Uncharacterised protein [Corynebacterium ulcerans]|nr:Uncharacterised protein [Corynebacterium ulcerans]